MVYSIRVIDYICGIYKHIVKIRHSEDVELSENIYIYSIYNLTTKVRVSSLLY